MMKFSLTCMVVGIFWAGIMVAMSAAGPMQHPTAHVKPCDDFAVTGDGSAGAWEKTEWIALRPRSDDAKHASRFKLLYSKTGLYILFDGADAKLTATLKEDFAHIWTEDCFEAFLWPDEKHTVYFEYEISPLGYELPILVPNFDGRFTGWRPWNYDGGRKTKKLVKVTGGPQEPGAAIKGWRAEVFIPYELLTPLTNVPPKPGSKWRANFYRMDYDSGQPAAWDWSRTGPSFHDYDNFGTLIFD